MKPLSSIQRVRPTPRVNFVRAFTLIEVMMALAILVLLAGGLFGTVRATLEAASNISRIQHSREQIFGFFQLCQQSLRALPASAIVVWGNREEKGISLPELILRNAPQALAWGDLTSFQGEIVLQSRLEQNGSVSLGLEQRAIDPATGQTLPNPAWLPLLQQLEKVSWKFYDARNGQWQEFWNDPNQHPALIKLSLIFQGDPTVWSQTFWLPSLQAATGS